MEEPGRATRLLKRLERGDAAAGEELLPLVHDELRRLAASALGRDRVGHTLQPTALVNEAWIRLVEWEGAEFHDRSHFIAVAAKAMRALLVDHSRRRSAIKRGGDRERVALDQATALFEERAIDLVELSDALDELSEVDATLGRIVELQFFGGLGQKEIATMLGTSLRTVERGWRTARAWLFQRLAPGEA